MMWMLSASSACRWERGGAASAAARGVTSKAGDTTFMALPPPGTLRIVWVPAGEDDDAARIPSSVPVPTTIDRHAPVLRERQRAYTERIRSTGSLGHAEDCRECRARG